MSEMQLHVMRVGSVCLTVFVCLCVLYVSCLMQVACQVCQTCCMPHVPHVVHVWIGCCSVRVRVKILRASVSCCSFTFWVFSYLGSCIPKSVRGPTGSRMFNDVHILQVYNLTVILQMSVSASTF
jgi:hypothetical protein